MSKHTIDEIMRLGKSPLSRDRTAYEKAVKGLYQRADTSGFGWNPAGGEADDVDLHDMVDGVRELPRVPGVGRVAVVTMPAYVVEGDVARRATQRRIYVGHKGHHWRWHSILEDAPVLAARANPGASKGAPTALNMNVLVRTFGLANSVPNKIDAADLPHLSRCMKAGLLVPEGRARLVLTDAGAKARDAYIAANPGVLQAANDSRPNPGPKRRTPAILRHCVAKVTPKRGVSGAYAICTASLQRAGVMRGGKLTAAGKQRDAARRKRTPENKAKDAAFERVLRAPNQKDLRAVADALRVARRIRSDATARITRETPDYPILHVQYPRSLPWKSISRLEREVDKLGWRAWGIDERGIAFKPTSSVDID